VCVHFRHQWWGRLRITPGIPNEVGGGGGVPGFFELPLPEDGPHFHWQAIKEQPHKHLSPICVRRQHRKHLVHKVRRPLISKSEMMDESEHPLPFGLGIPPHQALLEAVIWIAHVTHVTHLTHHNQHNDDSLGRLVSTWWNMVACMAILAISNWLWRNQTLAFSIQKLGNLTATSARMRFGGRSSLGSDMAM
jgi:hypothetical protein